MVANTIGAGVYTTSGFTLQDMGSPGKVLAVWLLAAVLALAGAMSFGALSRAMPLSGGEYLFLSRLFHPAAGFIAGWVSLVAGFAGAQAFGALAMGAYLDWSANAEKALGVGLLILLAAIHGTLVKAGTWLQNSTVALKALFLALFIAIGWWALPEEVAQSMVALPAGQPDFWDWPFNVLMVGLSFTGFNAAIYVAEECHDPRRDIPRALLLGTLLTAALYLAVNAVFLYSAPVSELMVPNIATRAAEALGGPTLGKAVRMLVLLSLFTLVSGAAVSGPRVVAKMGQDGYLPRFTLSQASAVQCALAVSMTLFSNLADQLTYLSLTLSLISALAVATVFRLPEQDRPFLLFPLTYLIGTGLTATASLRENSIAGRYAIGTLVSGLVLYLLVRWLRPAEARA